MRTGGLPSSPAFLRRPQRRRLDPTPRHWEGVGALYVRRDVPFRSLILGGNQERGRRGGTENTPGIVGLGKAAEIATARAGGNAALTAVVERLWQDQDAPVFSLLSERVRLRDNWTATVRGHADILAAIRAGGRKAARDAMRAHLTQVLSVLTGKDEGGPRSAHGKVASRRRTR